MLIERFSQDQSQNYHQQLSRYQLLLLPQQMVHFRATQNKKHNFGGLLLFPIQLLSLEDTTRGLYVYNLVLYHFHIRLV